MSWLCVILVAAIVKGGTMTMGAGNAPKSFNAYVDCSHYTQMAFGLAYMPLLTVDDRTLELSPSLADRWDQSDDGREFTFHLDERAKWSDGQPVTAEDVKWTFDAVLDPKNQTGPWKAMLASLESPVVIDAHTVRFIKKGDSPKDWRDILHCTGLLVLPKHVFEGKDFNRLDMLGAVTGGPYSFHSAIDEVETVMVRNPNWWRRDAQDVHDGYNFDRIVFRYYAKPENQFAAFKRGKIDIYPVYSSRIMAKEVFSEPFAHNWILKRRVHNHAPIGFQGFAFNMRKPPFNDVRVRMAFAYLLDRDRMNRTLMNGEYFMITSYFQDVWDEVHPCRNIRYAYEPEKAATLLDEAGWKRNPVTGKREKDGRPFVFTYLSRGSDEDRFLTMYIEALSSQGIEMKIERKDFASWMRDMDDFNFQMTIAAWGAGLIKNPALMWHSSTANIHGSNNITGFANPQVDAIIERERGMERVEDRLAAYRRIDELIAAEVPYALTWNSDVTRILYWNRFGMPKGILPKYAREDGAVYTWWIDPNRDAELKQSQASDGFLPAVPLYVDFDEEQSRP